MKIYSSLKEKHDRSTPRVYTLLKYNNCSVHNDRIRNNPVHVVVVYTKLTIKLTRDCF